LFKRYLHKLLLGVLVICSTISIAQTQASDHWQKSYGIGVKVKSNGIGLAYQQQFHKSQHLSRFVYADFGSFKHTNESKIVNHKAENKMPFVYGKLFHTARCRALYGVSMRLIQPRKYNHVAVDIQGSGGIAIGIQRPVYLRIETIENDQKTVKNVKYSRQNVADAEPIIGYSKNGEGWKELEYRPGASSLINVSFTWNEFTQVSKRVNIGASMDYYPGGLPIMAFGQNPKLNATFFVGFMWVINQG
jgi:hypothetical protein